MDVLFDQLSPNSGRHTVYTYDDDGTWAPQAYTFAF